MASGMNQYKEPQGHDGWMDYRKNPAIPQKTPIEIVQQLSTHLLNRGIGFTNHQLFFAELANQFATRPTYPPYDIVGEEEGSYEIRLAIAGFSKDEVDITFKEQVLVISGAKAEEDEDKFFHKGIAARDFKLSFPLAEYVEVTGAALKDGILTVSLKRELPEDLQPKTIKIK
jgi:molecular chaperone IbpA